MNRMAKRAGALLLALCLAVLLAACSQTAQEESGEPEIVSLTPPPSPAGEESASAQSVDEAESVQAYSGALTGDGYFAGVTALDYVILPEIAEIEIPEDVATIDEKELQSELDTRLSAFTTTQQVTDRAVEDGDYVNIDYVGSVDGVEFDGGNTHGSGTTVTAGSTQYIDDFLIQIIGHMPGETFDVNVTFPENYGVENLNGKDAVFVTTINYIQETVTPELTDSFVYSNWYESDGWSTVEEANAGITNELLVTDVGNYLWDEIQDHAQVSEVPQVLYDYQVTVMKRYYAAMAEQYGMELDDFIQNSLMMDDMDALVSQNESALRSNAKASLIMQALSEQEGITVTDEDIAAYFQNMMNISDYSSYEAEYGRPYLALLAREDKAKRALGSLT